MDRLAGWLGGSGVTPCHAVRCLPLYVAMCFPILAFGARSLALTGGVTATASFAGKPAYSSLSRQSFRFQFRVHGWSSVAVPYGNRSIFMINPGNWFWCGIAENASQLQCSDWWDTLDGAPLIADLSGKTDFVAQLVRDVDNMIVYLEVCDVTMNSCSRSQSSRIQTLGSGAPSQIVLGAQSTSVQLAYFRWRTGTGPLPRDGDPQSDFPNLADFEFETNVADSTSRGLPLAFTGSASYVQTPIYDPACHAGAQRTFRAGYKASLDGTESLVLDGSPGLTYVWQQLSGPTDVVWSSKTVSQPIIDGLIFGTYVFQLSVTDGRYRSATCTVKHGAVATDANNTVITGKPEVDTILGPLTRFGLSPWPFFDKMHKDWADKQGQLLMTDPMYADTWNTALSGTITATYGSGAFVGQGTTFRSDFCAGGEFPPNLTAPNRLVVWVPDGNDGTGRRMHTIRKCTNDNVVETLPFCDPVSASATNYACSQPVTTWAMNPRQGQMGITSIVVLSNVATITFPFGHAGTVINDGLVIVGAVNSALNGLYSVQSVQPDSSPTSVTISTSGVADGTYTDSSIVITRTRYAHPNGSDAMTVYLRPDVSCAGDVPMTLNVNGLGAVPVKQADGVTDPAATQCATNLYATLKYDPAARIFTIQSSVPTTPDNYPSYWARYFSTPGSTSELQYSAWTEGAYGTWGNGSTNANYYDNVMAFYALYYRTGIDDYLNYARTLADRWWTIPPIDRGTNCSGSGTDGEGCMFPRIRSVTGLILRALDEKPNLWPGLRTYINSGPFQVGDGSRLDVFLDIREDAYQLAFAALAAMFDPDTSPGGWRQRWQAALTAAINNRWWPQRRAAGNWESLTGDTGSWGGAYPHDAGTVSVRNGDTQVIGTGSTGWDSSVNGQHFWTVKNELEASTADRTYYTVTYVSPTELRLNKPFEGPDDTGRKWMMSSNWVGFGTQPFMLGIVGSAMRFAYHALKDTDPATAAKARAGVIGAAKWLSTTAYKSDWKGLWYGVGFGVCASPENSPAQAQCQSQDGLEAGRALSGEIMGTMAQALLWSDDPVIRQMGDVYMGAMFGKVGYGGPQSDGTYLSAIDGWFFGQRNAGKWLGFFWGFGAGNAWLSARQGAIEPEMPRTVAISLDPGPLLGAASSQVEVTAPSRSKQNFQCSLGSVCNVTIDPRQGHHWVTIKYLSDTGRLVAPATRDLLR